MKTTSRSADSWRRTAGRLAAVTILGTLLMAAAAEAQYFGRNKVRYRSFDFQVLETQHFDIYFYPEERTGVAHAARMAERWHSRLTTLLEHELTGRQPLILYAAQSHFQQTNAVPGEIGEATGGVTEALRRRIVLPLAGPLADSDHVIGHELVHAFQFDITTRPEESGGGAGALRLPLWFIEGMAEYLSIGPVDPHTAMWLRDAARKEELPRIADLDDPEYFPYRWGHAFWAYVGGRWGDRVIGPMLRTAARTGDPELAIQRLLGLSEEELSRDWHTAIREAYEPVLRATELAGRFGRLLIGPEGLGGSLNVSPSVSPDGKLVAFLSERGLFSIDLYVTDTATGRIVRRLTQTALSPHFSSLQFISSAGAWDSSGRRIAVAAISGGRPVLALFDVSNGRLEREVRIDQVDEIFNPTWSPDGRSIAFAALTAGLTDLFVIDLQEGNLRRLTNDAYAELHPAWSPDGRRIAFATDRFSTTLSSLDIGDLRIALIDPATGDVIALQGEPRGKHISPNWSPDSRSLYFLSDAQGPTNIHQVDIAGGIRGPITNVQTGIGGIAASSPALSVARGTGLIAFSAFEDGEHRIYVIDPPAVPARGETSLAGIARSQIVTLPPLDRVPSDVAAFLSNVTAGLPPGPGDQIRDYTPRLGLTAVGQPTVAVGADRFGTYAGGGLAFLFSDMLGDHNLVAAAQLNTSLTGDSDVKDFGGLLGYQNLDHRWNWAATVEQAPYRSGTVQQFIVSQGGQRVGVQETLIFRQTVRAVQGIAAYPFNRSQRLEFGGGIRTLSFDEHILRETFSLSTGQLLAEERRRRSLGDPLRLGHASAALVYDSSFFGATSPVLGQRYRLEVAPTAGSINFTSAIADYRRYFMPVRFYTFAARLLHFGRYGPDGEDRRMTPLFLGYPDLVRGYDVGSFRPQECSPTPTGRCPEFDRLLGSRVLVGNVEFRFPLLRPFGESATMYGPVPVEVAFFADGGVAWNRGERPALFGGARRAVSSAGLALRLNALGYAIMQLSIARPFDRPGQGWVFQFSLVPGF